MISSGSVRFLQLCCEEVRLAVDVTAVRAVEDLGRFVAASLDHGPTGWLHGGREETPAFSVERRFGSWLGAERSRLSQLVRLTDAHLGEYALLVERVVTLPEGGLTVVKWQPMPAAGPASRFWRAALVGDQLSLIVEAESVAVPAGVPAASLPVSALSSARSRLNRRLMVAQVDGTDYWLGFALGQIVEICAELPSVPVPGAPAWWRSVAHYRRGAVPVLEIAPLLGVEEPRPSASRRWVVARFGSDALFAVGVSGELRIIELPADARPIIHTTALPHYWRSAYEWSHGRLILPALERLCI